MSNITEDGFNLSDKKIGFKLKNKYEYGDGSNFVLGLGYSNHSLVEFMVRILRQIMKKTLMKFMD